eukprot:TRINITY_DN133_c0_g1_i1.p2 TRINITY_DN133_c0_g1~~TRINITY_DN133_c0_g1_i1.p2  ORF type:complete len:183 (-),score=49.20 TRINITY_DN133_c0_g1_i1:180-728(-)
MDGVEKFLGDLKLDPMDPVTLVISYHMNAAVMGTFTKEEFVNGFAKMRCETMDDLRKMLPTLRKELDDWGKFKEVYQYTFAYAKEQPTAKNLEYESAKALWNVLLKGRFPWLDHLNEFLDAREKKTAITKDQWNMLLEFHLVTKGDLSKYEDDGAWPTIIDEFVEFIRSKNAQALTLGLGLC